mmetsp:Transcript_45557/g.73434  ORF Transcript_45557/g.73434 Transcript_45557/m.73434 type:complete len:141 (+) Transcript_45557:33-455(+)|eukprot:CAMPEP_0179437324 /NCGR_PEP_ID=MMETSP0799-20121207/21238_1 /TAXON_ID=46947 /ORGANISM="Geminigera cryophila, Strain CCMP2564" /LENGTH=140 /DNA_ID=CAMNT_0021218189 /DNA_START=23 /DNA_END=445 /DNA_ORIENTATION=+
MTSQSPRTRPVTGAHWKNSPAAKADAVQWLNQRNIRVVLEHVTSELLQAQPDDPLEFMIEVLQRGQNDNAAAALERPVTAASTRPPTAQGKEDEVLAGMQMERDHWKKLFEEEEGKAKELEQEIAVLQEKIDAPPPADED